MCGVSDTAHLSRFLTPSSPLAGLLRFLEVTHSIHYVSIYPSQQGSSEDRRTGVRVNLTLPPEVDHVLARVAEAAGTGKSSIVRELLVSMVPQLGEMAAALEGLRAGQVDSLAAVSKALRGVGDRTAQAELELKSLRAMARKRRR
jgi:predicted DNA-binding protein